MHVSCTAQDHHEVNSAGPERDSGGSSALNTFAHLGFVARGIAYSVIGVIALMVAQDEPW